VLGAGKRFHHDQPPAVGTSRRKPEAHPAGKRHLSRAESSGSHYPNLAPLSSCLGLSSSVQIAGWLPAGARCPMYWVVGAAREGAQRDAA
jgi:hypothetical protein